MRIARGNKAIGKVVAKDFGELGIFWGEITDFEEGGEESSSDSEESGLYRVIYEDDDCEDWDEDEYEAGFLLACKMKKQRPLKMVGRNKANDIYATFGSVAGCTKASGCANGEGTTTECKQGQKKGFVRRHA